MFGTRINRHVGADPASDAFVSNMDYTYNQDCRAKIARQTSRKKKKGKTTRVFSTRMVLSEIPHNANKVNLVARDPCNTQKK